MFCEKCGNKIEDNAAFCPKCGAAVAKADVNIDNNAASKNASIMSAAGIVNNLRNKYIGMGAIALVAFVILFVVISNRKITVNLDKYVDITYSGYNTVGKATYTFDREKFDKDFGNKIKFTKKGKKQVKTDMKNEVSDFDLDMYGNADIESLMDSFGYSPAQLLSESVYGTLDKTSGLSNGDKVVYTWSMSEEDIASYEKYLNCKIKYGDIEKEVEGLEEAATFDPFEGITVTFSGVSPEGYADYEQNGNNDAVKYLYYSFDKNSGLSNGDEVKLTVNGDYYDDVVQYCLEEYGLIPSPIEKTYTVEGLSSYISSMEEINEDVLTKMDAQAQDALKARVAQDWDENVTLQAVDYIGSYFLTEKPGMEQSYKNMANLVYRVNANISIDEADYNQDVTFYYYTQFKNIMKLEDGTIALDINDYQIPGDEFVIDTGVDSGWWSSYCCYFRGYDNLDTMFNKIVTQYVDRYSYENSVAE